MISKGTIGFLQGVGGYGPCLRVMESMGRGLPLIFNAFLNVFLDQFFKPRFLELRGGGKEYDPWEGDTVSLEYVNLDF